MKDIIDLVDFKSDYEERIVIVGSYGQGEDKEIQAVVPISLSSDYTHISYEVNDHDKLVETFDNLKDAILKYNTI